MRIYHEVPKYFLNSALAGAVGLAKRRAGNLTTWENVAGRIVAKHKQHRRSEQCCVIINEFPRAWKEFNKLIEDGVIDAQRFEYEQQQAA